MCRRAKSATFADLVIANCTFDGTDEAQSVIEVSECHARDSPGVVILRGVAFRKNGLVGASGLRMSVPSCSELEMIDVEFADNVCSSDGCGVFLAKKSNLENCTASRNRVVKSNKRTFSLLYAPASSNTMIQGLVASGNDLAVLRVQDGDLFLSDASFSWNSLDNKHAGGDMNYSSCIHVVKSSAAISNCSFTANEGYNGSSVLAEESNVSVSTSVFRDNLVARSGGCVYALMSNVTLANTTATNNSAESDGGFICVEDSNVTLETITANNNSAESDGGFMYVKDSNVTLENTTANNNSADDGGFMYVKDSNVTLENTTANNSRAGYGGFMYVWGSNVTLETTTANNNSAESAGGFMRVRWSNVTLETTTANNNSAESDGGFMYVKDSNVTLENTTANNNSAESDGGFMYVKDSNVTLETTTANNNSADDGGFMYVEESNVTLENTTANNNSAESDGGFMCVRWSNVTLETTTANNNSADDGGFMYVEESNVTLENTTANNSRAGYGGFMYVWGSNVTLENTTANNSRAGYGGGFVSGLFSELRIALSQFSSSNSNIAGGFADLESSSIFMNDSEIVCGRSKNGGAIWMGDSNMTARNLSISHCSADNNGGGVMGFAKSAFLCTDCKFENNSAQRGNGGAVFFDSQPNQTLALQIVQSRFENNAAELGGRTCRKKSTAFHVYV